MSEALRALAEAYGVATSYEGMHGHVTVSDDTLVAVLAALGIDAGSPEAIADAAAQAADDDWRRPLPLSVVQAEGVECTVEVHVRAGADAALAVYCEDGSSRSLAQVENWRPDRPVDGVPTGEASFTIPGDVPLGYHELVLTSEGREHRARLVVHPAYLGLPRSVGERRVWGYGVQLYSVRSRGSWGIGDFVDLADLAAWSAYAQRADYILINPIHAGEAAAPIGPSPYSPTSRQFINPIYLRPDAIPEFAWAAYDVRNEVVRLRDELNAAVMPVDTIDRNAVWQAKNAALQAIYDTGRSAGRQMSYDAFVRTHGEALARFATWCAISERHGHDWREWPQGLRRYDTAETAEFVAANAPRVDYFRWLQWIAHEQRGIAQVRAVDAGMAIGIVNDIAVGVGPDSCEVWSTPELFAPGVSVGAPPDDYNRLGQDWTQSPWHPRRLDELGGEPFRALVRSMLSHSGGIRVDHIIGLFRLWWVPAGHSPTEATYVRYDHELLLGILLLEASRADALVVGEDLGTVEGWVRTLLAERGILGTSVVWFEHAEDGAPLPAADYRELSMSSVTTHDLAPTAGYLRHEHLAVRDRLNLLGRPLADEVSEFDAELARYVELFQQSGLTRGGNDDTEDLVLAVHRFLRATPSRVLNVALTDAAGDRRMQNQPGTRDEYPNWRVPLTGAAGEPMMLEDLFTSERAARLGAIFTDAE